MEPYFTISLSIIGKSPPDFEIQVTVTSANNYKGTVGLTYTSEGATPLYIDPTNASVYVPKNGDVMTTVSVGVAAGDSIVLDVDGSDDNGNAASASIGIDG